jgi:hypothetical protein
LLIEAICDLAIWLVKSVFGQEVLFFMGCFILVTFLYRILIFVQNEPRRFVIRRGIRHLQNLNNRLQSTLNDGDVKGELFAKSVDWGELRKQKVENTKDIEKYRMEYDLYDGSYKLIPGYDLLALIVRVFKILGDKLNSPVTSYEGPLEKEAEQDHPVRVPRRPYRPERFEKEGLTDFLPRVWDRSEDYRAEADATNLVVTGDTDEMLERRREFYVFARENARMTKIEATLYARGLRMIGDKRGFGFGGADPSMDYDSDLIDTILDQLALSQIKEGRKKRRNRIEFSVTPPQRGTSDLVVDGSKGGRRYLTPGERAVREDIFDFPDADRILEGRVLPFRRGQSGDLSHRREGAHPQPTITYLNKPVNLGVGFAVSLGDYLVTLGHVVELLPPEERDKWQKAADTVDVGDPFMKSPKKLWPPGIRSQNAVLADLVPESGLVSCFKRAQGVESEDFGFVSARYQMVGNYQGVKYMMHDLDTSKGDSGTGLYVFYSGATKLAAIHAGDEMAFPITSELLASVSSKASRDEDIVESVFSTNVKSGEDGAPRPSNGTTDLKTSSRKRQVRKS